jgi:hypothetical protein
MPVRECGKLDMDLVLLTASRLQPCYTQNAGDQDVVSGLFLCRADDGIPV